MPHAYLSAGRNQVSSSPGLCWALLWQQRLLNALSLGGRERDGTERLLRFGGTIWGSIHKPIETKRRRNEPLQLHMSWGEAKFYAQVRRNVMANLHFSKCFEQVFNYFAAAQYNLSEIALNRPPSESHVSKHLYASIFFRGGCSHLRRST